MKFYTVLTLFAAASTEAFSFSRADPSLALRPKFSALAMATPEKTADKNPTTIGWDSHKVSDIKRLQPEENPTVQPERRRRLCQEKSLNVKLFGNSTLFSIFIQISMRVGGLKTGLAVNPMNFTNHLTSRCGLDFKSSQSSTSRLLAPLRKPSLLVSSLILSSAKVMAPMETTPCGQSSKKCAGRPRRK